MRLGLGRIVTGLDEFGKGLVVSGQKIKAVCVGNGQGDDHSDLQVGFQPRYVPTSRPDHGLFHSAAMDNRFRTRQRTTRHPETGRRHLHAQLIQNWSSNGTVPAVTAFILIDAVSFEAGGEKRGVPGVMSPATDESKPKVSGIHALNRWLTACLSTGRSRARCPGNPERGAWACSPESVRHRGRRLLMPTICTRVDRHIRAHRSCASDGAGCA